MPTYPEFATNFPPPAIRKCVGAAFGAVLALFAIAMALIVAAINPALNGHAMAVATGIGIGMTALAVIAGIVVSRLRLPNDNDAWIFW